MAEEKKSHLPAFLKKLLNKNKDKPKHEADKSPGESNNSTSKVPTYRVQPELARLEVSTRMLAI